MEFLTPIACTRCEVEAVYDEFLSWVPTIIGHAYHSG